MIDIFLSTAQNDFENGGIVDRNVGNNSSRQPITNTGQKMILQTLNVI